MSLHFSLPSENADSKSVDDEGCCSTSDTPGNQIYIGGLNPKISFLQVKQHFSQYGKVKNLFISPCKRYGHLTFADKDSVPRALAEKFQFINGARVEIKPYSRKNK